MYYVDIKKEVSGMPIHNNLDPAKLVDLILPRKLLSRQTNEKTVSEEQTPLGQGVTTVEQYKTIISSKITSLATDMQVLNKNLHGMTVPVMPDKDELVEISEDGTLDDEAYQDALDEYNEQMANYNQKANELRNKIAQLAAELQKLNKILLQLKQVEGDTISQDLKDQVADAVANKEEITAADDITTDNMEVQVYIDKFKAQRAELVLPVEGINSEIEKLGGINEPVFANFVNSDGTIDVDGYKAAINEYNQAQQKIIELVEQLKEIKRQTDELDALITELGKAKTVQDFRDKLMEHHKLSIAQTQDIEEISPELINEQIESTQQEINGLAIEKAGYVGALTNLNGQVSSLIDDFTNAFNNAPKLEEFVQNGIPNVQAYNAAVEKYNTEQENRLKSIDEKLKLIVEYENKCKEIDDKISGLNEKLVQLEEKAAQLKADMDTLQALEGKEYSSMEEIQAAVDGLGVEIIEQGKEGNVTRYNVGNDTLGWVAVTIVEETEKSGAGTRGLGADDETDPADDDSTVNNEEDDAGDNDDGIITNMQEAEVISIPVHIPTPEEEAALAKREADIKELFPQINGQTFKSVDAIKAYLIEKLGSLDDIYFDEKSVEGSCVVTYEYIDGVISATATVIINSAAEEELQTEESETEEALVHNEEGNGDIDDIDESEEQVIEERYLEPESEQIATPEEQEAWQKLWNALETLFKDLEVLTFDSIEALEDYIKQKGLSDEVTIKSIGNNEYQLSYEDYDTHTMTVKIGEASTNDTPPAEETAPTTDATGLLDPLSFTSLEELQAAMADKTVNLRNTFCNGVFCQDRNPDKEQGDYTQQKHYVWNNALNRLEELSGVYYIKANGTDVFGGTIYNAALQAVLQGYNYTTTDGVFEREGKYYKYDDFTNSFVETEAPKPSEPETPTVETPTTDENPETPPVEDPAAEEEPKTEEEVPETTAQTFETPTERHNFITDTLNDLKEYFEQYYKEQGETGNFKSVWANVFVAVHNGLGDKESLTKADVINAAIEAMDSGIAKAREGAAPKIDINGDLDTTNQTLETPTERHTFITDTLNEAKESSKQYYEGQTGKVNFESVWANVCLTVHNELGEKESLTQADVINAAKAVLEAEIEKAKETSVDVNGELDTTTQTFDNPGQTHPFIDRTLLGAVDSFRKYYKEQTGKDDFESVWTNVIQTMHNELGEKESLTQADVINAARAELDKLITDADNQNIEKIKGYVINIINSIKGGDYQALTGLKIFEKDGVEFSVTSDEGKYVINIVYADGNINETINIDETDEVTETLTSNGFTIPTRAVFGARGMFSAPDTDAAPDAEPEPSPSAPPVPDAKVNEIINEYYTGTGSVTGSSGIYWTTEGYIEVEFTVQNTDGTTSEFDLVVKSGQEQPYRYNEIITSNVNGVTQETRLSYKDKNQTEIENKTIVEINGDSERDIYIETRENNVLIITECEYGDSENWKEPTSKKVTEFGDSKTTTKIYDDEDRLTSYVVTDSQGKKIREIIYEYGEYVDTIKEILYDEHGNVISVKEEESTDMDGIYFEESGETGDGFDETDGGIDEFVEVDEEPDETDEHTYYEDDGKPKDTGDAPNEGDGADEADGTDKPETPKESEETKDSETKDPETKENTTPLTDEQSHEPIVDVQLKPGEYYIDPDTGFVEWYDDKGQYFRGTTEDYANYLGYGSFAEAEQNGMIPPDCTWFDPVTGEQQIGSHEGFAKSMGFGSYNDYVEHKDETVKWEDENGNWRIGTKEQGLAYAQDKGFDTWEDYNLAKNNGISDSREFYIMKAMGQISENPDNEMPGVKKHPIKDKDGKDMGMTYEFPDGTVVVDITHDGERRIQETHPDGTIKITCEYKETGVTCVYEKVNGKEVLVSAKDKDGKDITNDIKEAEERKNRLDNIIKQLNGGGYGTGSNFNRTAFMDAWVSAGGEAFTFTGQSAQDAFADLQRVVKSGGDVNAWIAAINGGSFGGGERYTRRGSNGNGTPFQGNVDNYQGGLGYQNIDSYGNGQWVSHNDWGVMPGVAPGTIMSFNNHFSGGGGCAHY